MERVFSSPTAWQYEGWASHNVSYYDVVEATTNLTARGLGDVAVLPCDLGKNLPPGTYSLWVAFAAQGAEMKVGCPSVGDTSVAPLQYSENRWTKLGEFTSGVSFSSLSLEVTKMAALNERHVYWFAGVGVTPKDWALLEDFTSAGTWQPLSEPRWADFSPILVTNETSSLGNLLHNSSFEVNGLKTAGWSSGREPFSSVIWLSEMAGGEGWHGSRSAVISSEVGSRYRLYGPALVLPGAREVRPYTLSFYAKTGGESFPLSVYWNHTLEGAAGVVTNEIRQMVFVVNGEWTRFATNLWIAPLPNRGVWFDFAHVTGDKTLLIDAVQFEEGVVATPYAPADVVELGLSTPHPNGNIFAVNEERIINYELWNNLETETRVQVRTEVYDYMNRRVANLTDDLDLSPGLTTISRVLPTTNMGQSRVVAWCNLTPSFRTEMSFTVLPTVVFDRESAFGIHGPTSVDAGSSNVAWGLGWQRGLSVAGFVQWTKNEPSEGVYEWGSSDKNYADMLASGYEIVASLDSAVPAWALTSNVPRLDRLSNYVYLAVSRYPAVQYWESFNEPSGFTDTVGAWTAATFAPIEETLINAVYAANPAARYVALGGAHDVTWAQDVWNRLSPEAQSRVHAVSCHLYPIAQGGTVPDNDTRFEQWRAFGIQIGKPVWNTEAGVWGWGDYKGDKLGGLRDLLAPHPHRNEHNVRRMNWEQPALAMRNVINSLGNGFERYFYYDARLYWYYWREESTQPSLFNFDDSYNSIGTAYLWAKHFIDMADSTAQLTNTVAQDVRAYVFERDSALSTLALFTRSRQKTYSVTLTEPAAGIYDMMGNPISSDLRTFEVGSRPVYVISSSPNLAAQFMGASIVEASDTTAPNVSIDLSPHGRPTERSMPHRIWVTAIDDLQVPGDETPNNVLTRWRLAGGEWNDWSMQRYFELDFTPVFTWIEAEAMDLNGNVSGTINGPEFGSAFATAAPSTPPGSLQATPASSSEILLSWTFAGPDVHGFEVYKRRNDEAEFSWAGSMDSEGRSFAVLGLRPETLHHFFVRAINNAGSTDSVIASTTTLPPEREPDAPGNLVATAYSDTAIDLMWADNSTDEAGFALEVSSDGLTWALLTTLQVDTVAFRHEGLTPGQIYHYRVSAYNSRGFSPPSATAMAAPLLPTYAGAETLVAGTVVGTSSALQESDGVVQQLTERLSGGKPASRYSYVEYLWTFDLQPGTDHVFWVRAYQTQSSDGDQFVFAYTSGNGTFHEMVAVASTDPLSDYQSFVLPPSLQGPVTVRLTDTDRQVGNLGLDAVFIDHMFILTELTTVPAPPSAPVLESAVPGDQSVTLTWSPSLSATSYQVGRGPVGGPYFEVISGIQATTYTDVGLQNGTTYEYRIVAVNAHGESDPSNPLTATPVALILTEPPQNLVATAARRKINLNWTQSTTPGITHNVIYWSDGVLPFSPLATLPPSISYQDSVSSGVTRHYVVTAISNLGESEPSNTTVGTAR